MPKILKKNLARKPKEEQQVEQKTGRKKTKDTPKWVEEAEQQLQEQPLLGKVGSFKKSEMFTIVAEISEFKEQLKLDLREYQISESYTGPTKKGINIDTESFMDLYNLMTKVKERLEMHGQLQE